MKYSLLTALLLLSACSATITPGTAPTPGSSASPVPGATPAPNATTAPVAGTFRYLGMLEDKTRPGTLGGEDAQKDHTFSYSYRFAGEVTVKEVTISRIENGKPLGAVGWSTSPARTYFFLLAEANGRVLSQAKAATLGKLNGQADFKFYGSDAPTFEIAKPGTVYELMIVYTEGGSDKTLTQRTTL